MIIILREGGSPNSFIGIRFSENATCIELHVPFNCPDSVWSSLIFGVLPRSIIRSLNGSDSIHLLWTQEIIQLELDMVLELFVPDPFGALPPR